MKHLPIGGSTAPRTLACPAWLSRSKDVPRTGSSSYADIGNLIHDVLENYYQDGVSLEDQLGVTTFGDYVFSEEHLELTQDCIDATEKVLDAYDIDEIVCEPFVQIIEGEVGGSIDLLGVSTDGKTIVVLDYKTGQGKVAATDNKSILFYTLAASIDTTTADMFKKAKRFVSAIVQPKCYAEADVWVFSKKELNRFEDELMAAVDESKKENPRSATGAHCHYCPFAPYCPDKTQQAHSAMLLDTTKAATLAEALELTEELEAWINNTRKAAHELLEQGAVVPRYKLVAKRAIRKWTDKATAENFLKEALGDKAYKHDLITPPQAEKLLGKAHKDDIAPYVSAESSGTTLAHESDKRPAVDVSSMPENLLNLIVANS